MTTPQIPPPTPAATRVEDRQMFDVTDDGGDRHGAGPARSWALITALWCALPGLGHGLMRWSLALLFIWFGALKVLGLSPVTTLVAATVPGAGAPPVLAAFGAIEVVLGVALASGRSRRLVPLLLVLHLCGTFLSFVVAPDLTMRGGNPLVLTADGEFVMKNLVLISGALILAAGGPSQSAGPSRRPWRPAATSD